MMGVRNDLPTFDVVDVTKIGFVCLRRSLNRSQKACFSQAYLLMAARRHNDHLRV